MFSTEELTLALLVISRQLCKGVCWEMNNILIAPMSDAFMITKTLYPVISSYSLKMCDNVNIVNLKNTINILILFITGCYGFYCGTKMPVSTCVSRLNKMKLFSLIQFNSLWLIELIFIVTDCDTVVTAPARQGPPSHTVGLLWRLRCCQRLYVTMVI